MTVRPNVMIGLTHTPDARPIIREAKVLKVGIGYPRGKAADVFVDNDGAWNIRVGKYGADKKLHFETVAKFPTRDKEHNVITGARAKAEAAFRRAWKEADVCTYPRKVAYFQFTRPIMSDDGVEVYVPDFDAIEAHSFRERPGPPTEIDIMFLDDAPFSGSYQMWSASELKCSGDGENALRVLSMATTPEEKALASEAQAHGNKHFPVIGGCWTYNCPYSTAPCKPGASIKFQLVSSIRVGGTAFFHTSSFRSIIQIFSAIERIKDLTGGRIAGIPLKMVVRSHVTNHNNQKAIQQNVSIEFRASDMDSLRKDLIEQAWKFRQTAAIAETPVRMIEAAPDSDGELMSPQAITAEFYPEPEEDGGASPVTAPAVAATSLRTDSLSDRLSQARNQKESTEEPRVSQEPPTPPPVTPWADRAQMNAAFRSQRSRIGDEAFQGVLRRYDVLLRSLSHDDPKALTIHADMVATTSEVPF